MKRNEYDVIIIGAGIGGLTCGCYLAKAGKKVLIIEQHYKVGGYCTSFDRRSYRFDATCALGGCREDKVFGKIINDLRIYKKVEIIKASPTYHIVTPEYLIAISNDLHETKLNLRKEFPHQAKEIDKFIDFINTTNFSSLYLKLRNKTFLGILDSYFTDFRLKVFFSILVGKTGLPPTKLSALTAVVNLKEFIFDSGYYPKGGMQSFSDAFCKIILESGGSLRLRTLVKEIVTEGKKAKGVILDNGDFISSKFIVSNADATQTFLTLLNIKKLLKDFGKNITKMIPSISAFLVYLGINKNLKRNKNYCGEIWYACDDKFDDPWDEDRIKKKHFDGSIICSFPTFYDILLAPVDCESVFLGVQTPYKDGAYWDKNKVAFSDKIVERIGEIFPEILTNIQVKEIAVPQTLYKYTLCRNGSFRGWASFPSQIRPDLMPQKTPIDGLYLCGQWVTLPSGESGIPMAAYTGYKAAQSILKKE